MSLGLVPGNPTVPSGEPDGLPATSHIHPTVNSHRRSCDRRCRAHSSPSCRTRRTWLLGAGSVTNLAVAESFLPRRPSKPTRRALVRAA